MRIRAACHICIPAQSRLRIPMRGGRHTPAADTETEEIEV